MRRMTLILVALLATIGAVQAQDDSLSLIGANIDQADVYLLPNEYLWQSCVFWLDQSHWGNAQVVAIDYRYSAFDSVSTIGLNRAEPYLRTIGSFYDSSDGYSYRVQWNDDGTNANLHIGFLSGISYQNQFWPGESRFQSWHLTANVRYGDVLVQHGHHPQQWVHFVDGVWGDINGNGVVDPPDIQAYNQGLFEHGAYGAAVRYTGTGVNLGRGAFTFSEPSLVDAYRLGLALNDPGDPLIPSQIGLLMSEASRSGSIPAPYTVAIDGNVVTVYSSGRAAMVSVLRQDGTKWQNSWFTNQGVVTFYDLPADAIPGTLTVEAVTIDGVTDADVPPPDWREGLTPGSFTLGTNYPNPFNPSTTIPFVLEAPGLVELTVLNLLGREVAVLVNGPMSAGSHSISYSGDGQPSGMYIYRLQVGGATQARRMLLVK